MDPFTREEVTDLVATSRKHFPCWHTWLLCGLRTGMRAGELLALQWGDIDWRGRYIYVQRNLVRGTVTTPKNHQCRMVDLSSELRAVLRLWRRYKSAEWLKLGGSGSSGSASARGCSRLRRISVPPKAVSASTVEAPAVRSQFGFKMASVWNQRLTTGANSPIEPANRFRFSDFPKIRNVVAQICPRWNPLTSWIRQIEDFQRVA